MKAQIILFLIFLPILSSFAQNPDCALGTSWVDMETANIRYRLLNRGDMFWNPIDSPHVAKFTWPKNGLIQKNLLHSTAFWIGGIDKADNQIITAVQTYGDSLRNFWPGPIRSQLLDFTSAADCAFWNRHFVIERASLDSLFEVLGNYPLPLNPNLIPLHVKYWPGKGNQFLKSLALASGVTNPDMLDENLAPFADVNANGFYDPQNGDYPEIGSRENMVWWILNDAGNVKTYKGPSFEVPTARLEFHCSASSYPAINSQHYLGNSVFLDLVLINKGTRNLDSAYISLFADFDLGNPGDDYLQCDVKRNIGLAYTGDSLDEGHSGYGINPPAIGFKVLQGPKAYSNDGIDNNRNGIVDEANEMHKMSRFTYINIGGNFRNGDPVKYTDFYNFMQGKFKDDTPITYGGSGLSPVNSDHPPCRFVFPGTSDSVGYGVGGSPNNPRLLPEWTERTAWNAPGDRRALISSGPFPLYAGTTHRFSGVFLIGHGNSIPKNIEMISRISDSLDLLLPLIAAPESHRIKGPDFVVYPNPGHGKIQVFSSKEIVGISLLDAFGKVVFSQDSLPLGEINLEPFARGLYWIKVNFESGSVVRKVVVD